MPWDSQESYVSGQEIVIGFELNNPLYGHIEVKACPLGRLSSQACFDTPGNELLFVSDTLYDMPYDPNYPERGYLKRVATSNSRYEMIFKLPDHISGEQVL